MEFQTWKTIKLGTGLRTANDFKIALNTAGCRLGWYGTDTILNSPTFTVSTSEIEVELVNVSIAQLKHSHSDYEWCEDGDVRFDEIYERARSLNLGICPAEVGPQLRLQYLDQPQKNDTDEEIAGKADFDLHIGMEPVIINNNPTQEREFGIFYLNHSNSGLYLATTQANAADSHCGFLRFVFIKRK